MTEINKPGPHNVCDRIEPEDGIRRLSYSS